MNGMFKKGLMSAACMASMLVTGNSLNAYMSNLAQSQDVQRQVKLSHESIFSNAYELDLQKNENDSKKTNAPVGFFRILGYNSGFNKGEIDKDRTNDGGFLIGVEKSIGEQWTLGTFTGFQYADFKFKENHTGTDGERTSDIKGDTKSFISGVYGRYVKEKWLAQIVGSLGFSHYKHDGSVKIAAASTDFGANYYGWAIDLSGRASYDFSQKANIKFGPLVGFDCSYISNDAHCETAKFAADGDSCCGMDKHIVKSLKTFVGAFASKQFLGSSRPVMAYAELGWACECLRSGDKISFDDINSSNIHDPDMKLRYLPKSTVDAKAGVKALVSGSWYGGAALGLSCGSHYHNVFGELSIEKAF